MLPRTPDIQMDIGQPAEAPVSLVDYPDLKSVSDPEDPDQEGSPGAKVDSALLAALCDSTTDEDGDVKDGDVY